MQVYPFSHRGASAGRCGTGARPARPPSITLGSATLFTHDKAGDVAFNQRYRVGGKRASRRYPSDLPDALSALVSPCIPPAKAGRRPRTTEILAAFDAILDLLGISCQWPQLPADFPPWRTVHGNFRHRRMSAVWTRLRRHPEGPISLAPELEFPQIRRRDRKSGRPGLAMRWEFARFRRISARGKNPVGTKARGALRRSRH